MQFMSEITHVFELFAHLSSRQNDEEGAAKLFILFVLHGQICIRKDPFQEQLPLILSHDQWPTRQDRVRTSFDRI